VGQFMVSLHDFDAMYWDHEPPIDETTRQGAAGILPAILSSDRSAGKKPLAVARRFESADKSDALQTLRARGRVSGARVSVWSACLFSAAFPTQAAIRWQGRFMESLDSFFRVPWDHEPFRTPGQGTRPTSCRPGALTGRFMAKTPECYVIRAKRNA